MPHTFTGTVNVTRAPFLDLIAGLSYTIDARGADSGGGTLADPYLMVAGPGYFNLAPDEDSGVGRDARISDWRISIGGTYMFSVTGSHGTTGTYTLEISTGFGTARADSITGTATGNHIDGRAGADTIRGLGGADRLWGGSGADTLDGGADADWMAGGTGDDTYIVDSENDIVVERAGEGRDHVRVAIRAGSVEFELGANLEDLTIAYGARVAVGNAAENVITGSNEHNCTLRGGGGNDTLIGQGYSDLLDGGVGADTMIGGRGGDSYVVDNAGDRVIEREPMLRPTDGSRFWQDRVEASINYTLPENVEDLRLTGSARHGTGNELDNGLTGTNRADRLRGEDGADVLRGNGGGDELIGGRGADTFVYSFDGDSTASDPDRIRAAANAPAFSRGGNAERTGNGDVIQFLNVDASETVDGSQDFISDGGRGNGRLWFETDGTDTIVRANTRPGGGAEIEIRIEDGAIQHQRYRLEIIGGADLANIAGQESIVTLL